MTTQGRTDEFGPYKANQMLDFLLETDEETARHVFNETSTKWRSILEDMYGPQCSIAPENVGESCVWHGFMLEDAESEYQADEQIEEPVADEKNRGDEPIEKPVSELDIRLQQRLDEDGARARKEPPILQFSTAMYFCTESEKAMVIDVMRIGNLSAESKVHYTTRDVSAKAGVKYEHTAGVLSFGVGESEQSFQVPLRVSEVWETTTEFLVELLQEGLEGAMIGRYLGKARVKVMDSETFPSNKFREEILGQNFKKIPRWGLFRDYCHWNIHEPVVRKGTIKVLIFDQLHSCNMLLKLLMNVYLVDFILEDKAFFLKEDMGGFRSLHLELFVIAIFLVVPLSVLHVLDVVQIGWRIAGVSRSSLQRSLLRKFLNYTHKSRERLDRAELVMSMTRDAISVVQSYMNLFILVKTVGKLVALVLFQLLSMYLFDTRLGVFIFIVSAVFPLALIAFLRARRERTIMAVEIKEKRQDAFVAQVERVFSNYPLIADYNRRPFFIDRQAKKINEFNAASTAEAKLMKNNSYFSPWLTAIAVALYIVIGGIRVLNVVLGINGPKLSLGMFLTNLTVIDQIGKSWAEIYKVLLDIQETFPQLMNIVFLLNLETDMSERLTLNRARRTLTTEMRKSARNATGKDSSGLPIDFLPIKMDWRLYPHLNKEVSANGANGADNHGVLIARQGQLVAIIGPRGEGKTTLLKIVGGAMLPGSMFPTGALFVPSHLRGLHVGSEPLFFSGSLYENLTFGVAHDDPDGREERVLNIMKDLGLPDRVLKLMQKEHPSWGDKLSFTERCLCNIGRALVANAEMMCIQKPTMAYDEKRAWVVLNLLRTYVDQKGVYQDENMKHMRRPRTCIFTSSTHRGVEIADSVYRVSKEGCVEIRDKQLVTADIFE